MQVSNNELVLKEISEKLTEIIEYTKQRDKLVDGLREEQALELTKFKEKNDEHLKNLEIKNKKENQERVNSEKKITASLARLENLNAKNLPINYTENFERLELQNETLISNTTLNNEDIENSKTATVMGFTADAALIFVIIGVLPCYFVYRYFKSHFRLLNNIF